ncbi:hypothetical protein D8B26_007786 [Coccidioides posadasii str. Silveira]|nr:hypothetical protein D8B26_007786 [Coccidioides posadasii str. Silveira]
MIPLIGRNGADGLDGMPFGRSKPHYPYMSKVGYFPAGLAKLANGRVPSHSAPDNTPSDAPIPWVSQPSPFANEQLDSAYQPIAWFTWYRFI